MRSSAAGISQVNASQESKPVYGKGGRTAERRVDGLSRDEVCTRYQPRILMVARRLSERLPPNCGLAFEDLAGFGAIGLLEAFDRFDEQRSIQFSTFAEYRIRGAMMDALRQNDSFTRYRREMAKRLDDAVETLRFDLGRAPEPEEVAENLDVDLATYWHMVDTTRPISYVSIFDEDASEGGGSGGRTMAEVLVGSDGRDPFRALMGQDARLLLKFAIKELPERKRQCVILYYGRGLNLSEIARVFDVTPSRISQVLSSARRDLREMLEDQVDLGDFEWSKPGTEDVAL
jgi:RNA polymerase sigma factor for flagellar operon FliA